MDRFLSGEEVVLTYLSLNDGLATQNILLTHVQQSQKAQIQRYTRMSRVKISFSGYKSRGLGDIKYGRFEKKHQLWKSAAP